jgi:hypothetical protein
MEETVSYAVRFLFGTVSRLQSEQSLATAND